MNPPSREDLLGYLLGALDDAEQREVERQLNLRPQLRDELRQLGRRLELLGLDGDKSAEPLPPLCLTARTCEFVEDHLRDAELLAGAPTAGAACTPSMAAVSLPAPLSPVWKSAGDSHHARRIDWLVAAAAVLLLAALTLPALNTSRFQAQVNLCQDQLRQLGVALHKHSELDPLRRFPWIETSGNRSVAGVYAPTLVDRKMLVSDRVLICPASALATSASEWSTPSLAVLDRAAGELLEHYQTTMGGSYGYSLGYAERGVLQPVRDRRRPQYPLLADAPSAARLHRASLNHAGLGENLLYEDGHTQFVTAHHKPSLADDFYHNRLGAVAAGLDPSDAVIGASSARPLPGITVLKP